MFGEGVVDSGGEAVPGFLGFFWAGGELRGWGGSGEDLEEFSLGIGGKVDMWDAGEVEKVGTRGGGDVEVCEVRYLQFSVRMVELVLDGQRPTTSPSLARAGNKVGGASLW